MLYRLLTKQRYVEYHGHTDTVNAGCFSFNHKKVLSCSQDRTVRFWDMLTAKNVQTTNCGTAAHNMDLNAAEEMLVTAHNREIGVWDANTGKEIMVVPYDDAVTCAKFTPNELYIVATGKDNRVRLWDVRTWK